jgi:hypothetical protein
VEACRLRRVSFSQDQESTERQEDSNRSIIEVTPATLGHIVWEAIRLGKLQLTDNMLELTRPMFPRPIHASFGAIFPMKDDDN